MGGHDLEYVHARASPGAFLATLAARQAGEKTDGVLSILIGMSLINEQTSKRSVVLH